MKFLYDYTEYLRQFNREDYAAAYGRLKAESEKFFADMTEDGIDRAVSEIMDFTENELRRRLGRKAKCFDLRSFFCVYLCPAAYGFGTPAARHFADALCGKWNEAHPDFCFEVGEYEGIATGFRTKPFSF